MKYNITFDSTLLILHIRKISIKFITARNYFPKVKITAI